MNILKFLGRGLFSNKVIIDESKKQKLWLAFLILILSIVISIIPTFSNIVNVSGGDIVKNTSTQFDYSLQRLTTEYFNGNDAKLSFHIEKEKDENGNEKSKLIIDEGKSIDDLQEKKEITLLDGSTLSYFEIAQENESGREITLLVSYVKYDKNSDTTYQSLTEKATDVYNRLAGNSLYDIKNGSGELVGTSRVYSTFLFFDESFSVRLYAPGSTTRYFMSENTVTLTNTSNATAQLSGLYSTISTNNSNLNLFYNTNPDLIISKWKAFFDESYSAIKTQTLLVNCSVYSGLNLMIVLLMSLTLFIMTRFKSSACGKQSFGYCLKLVSFAALCPSLLSLLIGFMIPSFQSISFLTFVGLRSIFLSSRLTRGDLQEAPVAPKKK